MAEKPQPTVTEKLQPTMVQKPQPTVTEKPQPTVTKKLQPNMAQKPQPTVTEKPQPTVTEKLQPTMVQKPQPTVTEKPQPTVTEKLQPNMAQKPQPTVTEKPQPTVTEKLQPTLVQKPQPTVTEKPQPTVTEKPQPTVTEKPQPTMGQKPQLTTTQKLQIKAAIERKTSKIDYRMFQHAQIQGIPEAVETKQPYKRLTWLTAVLVTNVACGIHLYFLLQSFYEEPNETKVTFEPRDALMPPSVVICQPKTRFLDPESVSDISAEYYYALELGVGLIHITERGHLQQKINISQVEQYHREILRENNGSAAVAYRNFHMKHMRKCEDIFGNCYTELFTRVNCCDIFKPVFTLYGMCYASRNGSIVITGSDSLANFRFELNFTESIRPHFVPQKSIFRALSKINREAYDLGFVNGLDQGNFLVEHQFVHPNQRLTVNMVQKQSTLMYTNNPKVCIPNNKQLEFLSYFLEYTRSNCRLERGLLETLTLLNTKCELPLVELLNPKYSSSRPCNLTQIFHFFEYKRNDPLIFCEEDIKVMNEELRSDNFLPYISDYCNLCGNRTDVPDCTVELLLSIGLTEEANNYLYFFNNSQPYSLEQKFGEYLKNGSDNIEECLPLCNTTGHWLTMSNTYNEEDLNENTATVILQYTTKDVEKVTEEVRQTFAEYLAQIGGNIGMWNGASLLALGHLAALGVGALGFRPFHRQEDP